MSSDLQTYYARRAREYDAVYEKPERQADLALLKQRLPELLAGRDVLEVACGTGYWTAVFATGAASVVAADVNEEVLELARARQLPADRVRFVRSDAYTLEGVRGEFTAGFAGFWLSHVLKRDRRRFLDAFHAALRPGALVVLLDNLYVEGSNHPITRSDDDGNTYQQRRLSNGERYEVLKNFPAEAELRAMLGGVSAFHYQALSYFWLCSYMVD